LLAGAVLFAPVEELVGIVVIIGEVVLLLVVVILLY
jgi:hypothetical protein